MPRRRIREYPKQLPQGSFGKRPRIEIAAGKKGQDFRSRPTFNDVQPVLER
jgi:hypothetical protein